MNNKSFKVQFNTSKQSFKPKFSQKPIESKPKVEPKAKSIEDIYDDKSKVELSVATSSKDGLMSSTDKQKVDSLPTNWLNGSQKC